MGKTQKTTRRISQNPTMLSRQEGLLLFNPPDGKLALFDEWNSLAVYVSMDNTVAIEDIKKMCWSPPQSSSASHSSAHLHRSALGRSKKAGGLCTGWKPLLLIIPLRLGINHINPVYIDAFKECFKMPQSLGALGGNQIMPIIP
eukprot:XP_027304623.1 cysteine protease ATG4A-like isoform X2 [Anas platyrhynchos]